MSGVLPDWMIERDIKIVPFAPQQARPGIISYGVTSYGYDVRVDRKFKVFTNALCAIVDPKNFDPQSFVDVEGDFCLIPPNSFALAETIEYLEIPRDVIGVCLGKSTYARCFRGDTRVALIDGVSASLEEMASRSEAGEKFRGYTIDPSGRIIVAELQAPRYIGTDCLMEVALDSGEVIRTTPDHRFMLRDGQMREAHLLRPGVSLMPLYRDRNRGSEALYQPLTGDMEPTLLPYLHNDRGNNRCTNAIRVKVSEQARRMGRENDNPQFERKITDAFRGACPSRNHKVSAIRDLPGNHDVYCLTVPETANFALECGVFVHNCGIICNVTPLEPEWRGRITIEISNTTPLPAKIYSGEGIAQILFFRGEELCKTSYADKKGKYQDQPGLTLPFVQKPEGN